VALKGGQLSRFHFRLNPCKVTIHRKERLEDFDDPFFWISSGFLGDLFNNGVIFRNCDPRLSWSLHVICARVSASKLGSQFQDFASSCNRVCVHYDHSGGADLTCMPFAADHILKGYFLSTQPRTTNNEPSPIWTSHMWCTAVQVQPPWRERNMSSLESPSKQESKHELLESKILHRSRVSFLMYQKKENGGVVRVRIPE
jgi:hypothetical protein